MQHTASTAGTRQRQTLTSCAHLPLLPTTGSLHALHVLLAPCRHKAAVAMGPEEAKKKHKFVVACESHLSGPAAAARMQEDGGVGQWMLLGRALGWQHKTGTQSVQHWGGGWGVGCSTEAPWVQLC